MALISQPDLEARLGRALTAEETSAFTLRNAALQASVEKIIGSSVEAAELTTRYYDGGKQYTKIDPCTDIEWVKFADNDFVLDTDPLDDSGYVTEPVNNTIKTMISIRYGKYIKGAANLAVRAKFSIYADVNTRNIVKEAMLSALISEIGSTENIKKESIEGYSVEYATVETKNALDTISYLFPEI